MRDVFEVERRMLKKIGSRLDPAMFHAMRAHAGEDEAFLNRGVIVNFAGTGGGHACRFACPYCSWRARAEAEGDICPTREGLWRFLDGFAGYKVTISGGGDPLYGYHFRKRLVELVEWIHEKGMLAEVVTREVELADSFPEVDEWSFSVDAPYHDVREAMAGLELPSR